MLGINVKKDNDKILIQWQLTKIEIPISNIENISLDDTYAGEEKTAIRIGTPFATTDRVVIKTNKDTYILFTTNSTAIINKIKSYLN
ncbi:hypothetical protein [Heyndrickxia ginsengihumi]|uniref:SunI/YnzG family protein n=1 Tax=Heyndrickxia ginsengihumi TaxID=363870 RepID=UPI003D1C369A